MFHVDNLTNASILDAQTIFSATTSSLQFLLLLLSPLSVLLLSHIAFPTFLASYLHPTLLHSSYLLSCLRFPTPLHYSLFFRSSLFLSFTLLSTSLFSSPPLLSFSSSFLFFVLFSSSLLESFSILLTTSPLLVYPIFLLSSTFPLLLSLSLSPLLCNLSFPLTSFPYCRLISD